MAYSLLLSPFLPPSLPPSGTIESIFVVTPVETVKTKLIHLNMEFVGGVKHIVAKEGLSGVYQVRREGGRMGGKEGGREFEYLECLAKEEPKGLFCIGRGRK